VTLMDAGLTMFPPNDVPAKNTTAPGGNAGGREYRERKLVGNSLKRVSSPRWEPERWRHRPHLYDTSSRVMFAMSSSRMQKTTTIRKKSGFQLSCVSALPPKGDRRGWLNVWPGIDVNSDQSLNAVRYCTSRLEMLEAETFGVSGGAYAGLKPSLAQ